MSVICDPRSEMNDFLEDTDKIELNYYDMLNDVSVLLSEYRYKNGMTQKNLSERLGVSQAMVSRYENAAHNFSLKNLNETLAALGYRLRLEFVPSDEKRMALEPKSDETYVQYKTDSVDGVSPSFSPEAA